MRAVNLAVLVVVFFLLIFSYVSPVRLPPYVVAFKEALFAFVIILGLLIYSIRGRLYVGPILVLILIFILCALHIFLFDAKQVVVVRYVYLMVAVSAYALGQSSTLGDDFSISFQLGLIMSGLLLALFAVAGWHGLLEIDGDMRLFIPIEAMGGRAQSGLGQSNNFGIFLVFCCWLVVGFVGRIVSGRELLSPVLLY